MCNGLTENISFVSGLISYDTSVLLEKKQHHSLESIYQNVVLNYSAPHQNTDAEQEHGSVTNCSSSAYLANQPKEKFKQPLCDL